MFWRQLALITTVTIAAMRVSIVIHECFSAVGLHCMLCNRVVAESSPRQLPATRLVLDKINFQGSKYHMVIVLFARNAILCCKVE